MTKLKKFKPLSSNLSSTSKVNHIPTNWEMTGRHIGGTCSFLNLVEQSLFLIWCNMVISQFGGTQSFLNSVEHCHFYIFLIWWNTVIFTFSRFGGTQSFFNSMEHDHTSIWWNTVIFQFCGTQSFSIWFNTVIFQFCGTRSFLTFASWIVE